MLNIKRISFPLFIFLGDVQHWWQQCSEWGSSQSLCSKGNIGSSINGPDNRWWHHIYNLMTWPKRAKVIENYMKLFLPVLWKNYKFSPSQSFFAICSQVPRGASLEKFLALSHKFSLLSIPDLSLWWFPSLCLSVHAGRSSQNTLPGILISQVDQQKCSSPREVEHFDSSFMPTWTAGTLLQGLEIFSCGDIWRQGMQVVNINKCMFN